MIKWVIIWIRLCRPLIGIISIFGVMVGALNTASFINPSDMNSLFSPMSLLFIIVGTFSLSSGLMIHNDYADFESDKVNRPYKVLPSGLVSLKTAKWSGITLLICSIFFALFTTYFNQGRINWLCGFITLTVVLIGILYNYKGKYLGIWGHIFVAYGVGCIPFWGAIAVMPEQWLAMFPLSLSIFIMEIGREIMVCAGDIEGDIAAGYKTTPINLGRVKSMWLALLFYLLFPFFLPMSYYGWLGFPKIFSSVYMVGACIFSLVLFYTWVRTMEVAIRGDNKATWNAFERYIRLGTRLGVLFFQLTIFLDAFY